MIDWTNKPITKYWIDKPKEPFSPDPEFIKILLQKESYGAGVPGASKAAPVKGKGVEDPEALAAALAELDGMIGLTQAKREVRQNLAIARLNRAQKEMGLDVVPISRHMVFTGSPGTGKTTFARQVAKLYYAMGLLDKPDVVEVTRKDLVGDYIGQTAHLTEEQIKKAQGGVLFIDEAYSLTNSSSGKDYGPEAITTLLAAMENQRDNLIVIVAGYKEPMEKFISSNPGLQSRFTTCISFDDYSSMELGQIMDLMVKQRGYRITPEAREAALQKLEEDKQRNGDHFGNGRAVRNLVEKAEKAMADRLVNREGILDGKHDRPSDAFKDAITTITLSDINDVSLEGIAKQRQEAQKGPMGFTRNPPASQMRPATA